MKYWRRHVRLICCLCGGPRRKTCVFGQGAALKSCRTASAHTRTFRLAIRAPSNGHSLSEIFPFLRLRLAISGKSNWEQISGKRKPQASVSAIEAASFRAAVPIREESKVLKKHYEDHVRHAAGVGCSRGAGPDSASTASESAAMNDAANVTAVDHTGFAVSFLDKAVRFWTRALGFTLERQSEMGGDFLHQVTGVDDPSVKTAIVRAPDGYVVELLQYSRGYQNGAVPSSAGSIGAAHLALTVKDIHAAIARVEAAGWKAKGSPLPIAGGPRKGTLVAYVSGPDHITIELMQSPAC